MPGRTAGPLWQSKRERVISIDIRSQYKNAAIVTDAPCPICTPSPKRAGGGGARRGGWFMGTRFSSPSASSLPSHRPPVFCRCFVSDIDPLRSCTKRRPRMSHRIRALMTLMMAAEPGIEIEAATRGIRGGGHPDQDSQSIAS